MKKTKIEWCDSTWNPVTGCLHDCEYCYARKQAKRFEGYNGKGNINTENLPLVVLNEPCAVKRKNGKTVQAPYPLGFKPTFHRYKLNDLPHCKKPRTIFVCSMADLFGEWVPDEWIEEVFAACAKAPQHRYLFLTKNPKRYTELANKGKLPQSKNMWYGTSVTGPNMHYFCSFGTYNTFLSVEPLLKSLNAGIGSFSSTEWIIIGAETGNRKDKVIPKKEWIDNICEAAALTRASVFMKDSLIPIVGKENMRREFPWKTK